MGLGKQAKILTQDQQLVVLEFLNATRYPQRNRVIFLLSVKAGLRAKEIASITWSMATASDGQIADSISLTDIASKGNSGGVIWMNSLLKRELALHMRASGNTQPEDNVIQTERRHVSSSQTVINLFATWYKKLGFVGCSSHSGRRTFITNAAKHITAAGGSIRDVQVLARHRSLEMTQKYIEADIDAMKRVVEMV